ncbi:ubiquitin family protein [Coprinopsis cinerea AmutBmut pab1-1]|nr:ubiquitin family protein [Coprinopsis cinerea AmutBmut pab1-1]
MIQINVEVRSEVCDEPTGQRVTVKVKPDSKIGILHDAIEKVLGIARDAQRLLYGGRRVDITSGTFADYGIKSGDTIIVYNVLRGGKPVIYLFSPVEREVSVKLSLVPQWEFSAIYPVVPVKTASAGSGQEIEWTVTTSADGSLKERTTGLEVAYLFWEAETTRVAPLSPPPTPTIAATDPGDGPLQEVFVPNDAHLCSENSVVVETSKVTPYLDGALKALGLHTEARTSFITYWLPAILKHEYVALRFLPQSAYERAAPLDITPAPDVVLRIFMLFKGVDQGELEEDWKQAAYRATEPVGRWVQVVGVDVPKATDPQSFRVVEWGGMEIHR